MKYSFLPAIDYMVIIPIKLSTPSQRHEVGSRKSFLANWWPDNHLTLGTTANQLFILRQILTYLEDQNSSSSAWLGGNLETEEL